MSTTVGGHDIGFLDDLFVLPEARGSGVAEATYAALKELAANTTMANDSLDYAARQYAWPSIL